MSSENRILPIDISNHKLSSLRLSLQSNVPSKPIRTIPKGQIMVADNNRQAAVSVQKCRRSLLAPLNSNFYLFCQLIKLSVSLADIPWNPCPFQGPLLYCPINFNIIDWRRCQRNFFAQKISLEFHRDKRRLLFGDFRLRYVGELMIHQKYSYVPTS